jgi:hypothetical protein
MILLFKVRLLPPSAIKYPDFPVALNSATTRAAVPPVWVPPAWLPAGFVAFLPQAVRPAAGRQISLLTNVKPITKTLNLVV